MLVNTINFKPYPLPPLTLPIIFNDPPLTIKHSLAGVLISAINNAILADSHISVTMHSHISVTIANNMMQIKTLQTSTIVDLIFKLIISFHWSL